MNYNSPFIKMLETVANMLIVSFFWLVFSLPVITVVPASAALFHTMSKIVFGPGRGNGVFRDYLQAFKVNLKSGLILSVILILCVLVLLEGLWTGWQIYKISIWGMLYMILGVVLTLAAVLTFVNIPAVLSRFDAPVSSLLRIALYIGLKHPLRTLFSAVFLAVSVWMIGFFPLALLILPGLYTDLTRQALERDMDMFVRENGLEERED